ncbi:MAG: invasion associated locus B family protein [Alphaproteobacteria bacterium]|nr:invasion associated locus B family protein [Alphaproteobacteria bacterium]
MTLQPFIYSRGHLRGRGSSAIRIAVALFLFAPSIAIAKEKDLGTFGVWRAFSNEEGGQNICYMSTVKTKGVGKNQRVRYLMVTHRPVEGSSDVFSFGAGVPLDSKHGVTLKIGNDSFDLFAARDTAWAREAMTDHKISVALRSGKAAEISAIAAQSKITTLTEQFPLTGATEAYAAINKACGLPILEIAKKPPKKTEAKKIAPKKPKAVLSKKNASASAKKESKTTEKKTLSKKKLPKPSAAR